MYKARIQDGKLEISHCKTNMRDTLILIQQQYGTQTWQKDVFVYRDEHKVYMICEDEVFAQLLCQATSVFLGVYK